jgi:hypothetical protein
MNHVRQELTSILIAPYLGSLENKINPGQLLCKRYRLLVPLVVTSTVVNAGGDGNLVQFETW